MIENVLLISIDSLRADYSLPNVRETETSTFSTLSSEGISFRHAFATGPGTTSSFPGLLTGTLPLSYDGLGPLSADRPNVADDLYTVGLKTAGFQSNPFLSHNFNYDVGFDEFKDYQNPLMGIATQIFPRGIEINNPRLKKVDNLLNITELLKKTYQAISGKSRPYVSAEVITEDTINWLSQTEDPFFCWAHYMDVHHPCFPPVDIRRQFNLEHLAASQVADWYSTVLESPKELSDGDRKQFNRLYEASIVYTDQQISRIVDHLKSTGRWDDTLVIVTSDHGELFGEYGSYGKPIRMYDELLRIPLIIVNGPSYLSKVSDSLISLLDIPPLLHDALGEDIPTHYEGRLPDSSSYRNHVIAEHQVEDSIVIGARSKQQLYEYSELQETSGFYNVAPDTFDHIGDDQGAEQLRSAVMDRLNVIDVTVTMPNLEDDVEDRLEDLGYL